MSSQLHQKFRDALRRHRMFCAGDRVGVAVSGGADSVALLVLLDELRADLGITLLVLHFNHQLRGIEADADERFVADLATRRGLEFVAGRADVAAAARTQRSNLEDTARRLRYEFFAAAVECGRVGCVAVAHTADDQAETLLAHLLRGTGPAGLAAIYPVAGQVVRPLLDVRRQALRNFLRTRRLEWREDASNLDTTRLRARLRQDLLPRLETQYQPAVVAHLASLASLVREEEVFWSALVEDRFHALVRALPAGGLEIRAADLLSPLVLTTRSGDITGPAPPLRALTTRLVRHILAELAGHRRGLTARHVEQVLHLAAVSTSGRRIHLPGWLVVEREFDRLVFSRGTPERQGSGGGPTAQASTEYAYPLELSASGTATVAVPEIGKRFCLKVIDWPAPASDTRDAAAVLDRNLLRPPLLLRNWRPGDAYRPRGRQRVRKLKRLFLDQRIAARERAAWPVLTSAGRLVWAAGMPVADEFAAREGTNVGVVIAEEAL